MSYDVLESMNCRALTLYSPSEGSGAVVLRTLPHTTIHEKDITSWAYLFEASELRALLTHLGSQ